jgi:hypothetical protein
MALLSDATSNVAQLQQEVKKLPQQRCLTVAMPSPAWDWEKFHGLHKFLYSDFYQNPSTVSTKILVMIEVIEKLAVQAGITFEQPMQSMEPGFQELLRQRQAAEASAPQATAQSTDKDREGDYYMFDVPDATAPSSEGMRDAPDLPRRQARPLTDEQKFNRLRTLLRGLSYLDGCKKYGEHIKSLLLNPSQPPIIRAHFYNIDQGIQRMLEHKAAGLWDKHRDGIFEAARPWAQFLVDLREDIRSTKFTGTANKSGVFLRFRIDLKKAIDMFPKLDPSPRPSPPAAPVSTPTTPVVPPPSVPTPVDVEMGVPVPEPEVAPAPPASADVLGGVSSSTPLGNSFMSSPASPAASPFGSSGNGFGNSFNTDATQEMEVSPPSAPVDEEAVVAASPDVAEVANMTDAPTVDEAVVEASPEVANTADAAVEMEVSPSSAPIAEEVAVAASPEAANTPNAASLLHVFEGAFDTRTQLICVLNDDDINVVLENEVTELIKQATRSVNLVEALYPLLNKCVQSVWNSHDKDWFDGPAIKNSAAKWYDNMLGAGGFLAGPLGRKAVAMTSELQPFKDTLEDVMGWPKGESVDAGSGPLPDMPPSGNGNGGSGGGNSGPSSGPPLGPSSGPPPSSSSQDKGKGKATEDTSAIHTNKSSYNWTDVNSASKEDVLNGTGAFAPEHVRNKSYLFQIFDNSDFQRIYQLFITALTKTIEDKEPTNTPHCAFLRRACNYVIKAYSDKLFTYAHSKSETSMEDLNNAMVKLRDDVIEKVTHVDQCEDATELYNEIQTVKYILAGTYTGGEAIQNRVVAKLKKRTGGASGDVAMG